RFFGRSFFFWFGRRLAARLRGFFGQRGRRGGYRGRWFCCCGRRCRRFLGRFLGASLEAEEECAESKSRGRENLGGHERTSFSSASSSVPSSALTFSGSPFCAFSSFTSPCFASAFVSSELFASLSSRALS